MVVSLKISTLIDINNASFFFCCGKFRMCLCWEDKFIYVVILCSELFVWWKDLFFLQIFAEGRKNGTPPFLNLNKGVHF